MANDVKGVARTTLVKAWQIHENVKTLWNSDITTAVATEETARSNADAALQTELDATQTGAGLGADGAYSAHVAANYISDATSLHAADSALDAQVKVNTDAVATEATARSNADAALQTDVAALETGFRSASVTIIEDVTALGTYIATRDLLLGTTGLAVAANSLSVYVNGLLLSPTVHDGSTADLDYTVTDNSATTGDYTVLVPGLETDEYVQMKWHLIDAS